MMIDLPPPILSPTPYEHCLIQNGDWAEPLIHSSSSIGIGKQFLPKLIDDTKLGGEQKLYAILLDDDQLSIEISNEERTTSPDKSIHDTSGEAVTFIDRLNPIREQLALSITQLAELLGVTRKSIYDWYEGSEPRSNTVTRMEILGEALQSVSNDVDLTRLKVVWNIPIAGDSFREVYNNADLNDLLEELTSKLHELKPNMIKKTTPIKKQMAQAGKALLAELDKHADFS